MITAPAHLSFGRLFRHLAFEGALLLAPCVPAGTPVAARPQSPKLVEFGWDRPSPEVFRTALSRFQASPFDGVVIRLGATDRLFDSAPLTEALFSADSASLVAIPRACLSESFLLLRGAAPPGWAWTDDRSWRQATARLSRLSRLAALAGLRGILVDFEHYNSGLWQGADEQDRATTAPALTTYMRARGRAFVGAIKTGFPTATLLTTFQLSLFRPRAGTPDSAAWQSNIARWGYPLLPPFLEGVAVGAAGSTITLIDGNEPGYYYTDSLQYATAEATIAQQGIRLLAPDQRAGYLTVVRSGQAVFADFILGTYSSRTAPTTPNATRATRLRWLEHNVYMAMTHSDGYAWFYSQRLDWWKAGVDTAVAGAVGRGRAAAQARLSLGYDIADSLVTPK